MKPFYVPETQELLSCKTLWDASSWDFLREFTVECTIEILIIRVQKPVQSIDYSPEEFLNASKHSNNCRNLENGNNVSRICSTVVSLALHNKQSYHSLTLLWHQTHCPNVWWSWMQIVISLQSQNLSNVMEWRKAMQRHSEAFWHCSFTSCLYGNNCASCIVDLKWECGWATYEKIPAIAPLWTFTSSKDRWTSSSCSNTFVNISSRILQSLNLYWGYKPWRASQEYTLLDFHSRRSRKGCINHARGALGINTAR